MLTCNSQGKPIVFPEAQSHQIIEFLKSSTKFLYKLLYLHHQLRTYFFMGGTHSAYCQNLISCISITSGYDGNVEVDLWGEAIWDARHGFF